MLRLDRFLTLHVFRHLNRVLPQPKGIRIPILMYHSICDEPEKGHPYFWINTSPKRFVEHMKFLYENNYKVIHLSDAVRLIEHLPMQPNKLNGPKKLYKQGKYVVLTFDDGYEDFYTRGFPIFQEHGFKATVFLPTGLIDKKQVNPNGRPHLSWTEVRELQKMGITFGSHTVTHRQLLELDEATIKWELKVSKEKIEDEIGEQVEDFSYPYRFPEQDKSFTRNLEVWLKEYKYKQGISTRIGTIHQLNDRFALKRIPVNSLDDLPLFLAKLEGAYDWLHVPQNLMKAVRSRRLQD